MEKEAISKSIEIGAYITAGWIATDIVKAGVNSYLDRRKENKSQQMENEIEIELPDTNPEPKGVKE